MVYRHTADRINRRRARILARLARRKNPLWGKKGKRPSITGPPMKGMSNKRKNSSKRRI